ncbi:acyltransferase [Streptomyces clavifer]|uniref:acyltransferase family protein n=1 Tax=Streptomyces TaxID=1883 RepID=UPI0006FAE9EB|nr:MULTISPECIES: acyltransferase [unclassified Streptomyces]KQX79041.1 acyltransferase [Streptomyces sp. Root1319]KQZ21443.1 acyltransferase [Streptomyces sp. Root55]
MPGGLISARVTRDRLPSLTGLRFWAALVVVCYHLSRQAGKLPWISDLTWYGRSGVTFFFVLSGFVLAWTYDGKSVPAVTFFWRRFARIWPLLTVSVIASVAVWRAMGTDVSLRGVAATLGLVNAWTPVRHYRVGGNPAAWSLSNEAWFYLLFPLLLMLPLLRSARGRTWCAIALCAVPVAIWTSGALFDDSALRLWTLDYFPPTRTLQFVLGVVAGLAVKRGWRPPVGLPVAIALVVAGHIALIPWSRAVPDSFWYSPYSASHLLSAPVFALLVAAAATVDLGGRRTGLDAPWMIRLGHWSFAWYLFHEIVIRALLRHLGRPESQAEILRFWLLTMAISLVVAAMAYQWVERPLERLLRRAGPGGGTATSRRSASASQGDSAQPAAPSPATSPFEK